MEQKKTLVLARNDEWCSSKNGSMFLSENILQMFCAKAILTARHFLCRSSVPMSWARTMVAYPKQYPWSWRVAGRVNSTDRLECRPRLVTRWFVVLMLRIVKIFIVASTMLESTLRFVILPAIVIHQPEGVQCFNMSRIGSGLISHVVHMGWNPQRQRQLATRWMSASLPTAGDCRGSFGVAIGIAFLLYLLKQTHWSCLILASHCH